MNYYFLIIYYS